MNNFIHFLFTLRITMVVVAIQVLIWVVKIGFMFSIISWRTFVFGGRGMVPGEVGLMGGDLWVILGMRGILIIVTTGWSNNIFIIVLWQRNVFIWNIWSGGRGVERCRSYWWRWDLWDGLWPMSGGQAAGAGRSLIRSRSGLTRSRSGPWSGSEDHGGCGPRTWSRL